MQHGTLIINKGDHFFGRRSSSAWAKKAAALRIIYWPGYNSSSREISELLWPALLPESISACLIHFRKVSEVQSTFAEIDWTVFH
jgi:hypothetical protein